MERYLNKVNVTFTMAMTPAQKKATAAFKKKLKESKKHIASGGSKYSWDKSSSGGSSSNGKVTPSSSGVSSDTKFVTDPITKTKMSEDAYQSLQKARAIKESGGDIYASPTTSNDKITTSKTTGKITPDKSTVVVDGQGYTVKPELQEEFIEKTQKITPAKNKFT